MSAISFKHMSCNGRIIDVSLKRLSTTSVKQAIEEAEMS